MIKHAVLFLSVFSASAMAHKPSYSEGKHGAAEDAWTIEDPDVSIVLYHELTCATQVVWLRYEAETERDLFVQLGVPKIARLSDYQPTLGLIHPEGRQVSDLPFTPPEGYGVEVQALDSDRADFFEPFTQTESWILLERTVRVPAGVGYVAAWHPEGLTGKLWVAVGEREEFGNEDWEDIDNWYYNTRYFHEVAGDDPPVEIKQCELPPDASTGGCNGTGAGLVGLIGLLVLRRPRRNRRTSPCDSSAASA